MLFSSCRRSQLVYNKSVCKFDNTGEDKMKNKGWNRTLLLAGGHFWIDFYANMLPPLLPMISGLWGLSNSQLALLISVQSLTGNLLQPFLGYLLDKRTGQGLLAVAIAIMALPMSFIYLADNYLAFVILVTVAGLGSSLYHPLGASRSVDGAGSEHALKISVYSGLGSLGFAISPVITAVMVAAWGLKGLSYTIIPGLLWIVLLILFRQSRQHKTVVPQDEHVKKAVTNGSAGKLSWQSVKPLLLLSIVVACRSWLITACTYFLPVWMTTGGIDSRLSGLYVSLFLLAGTVGGFVFGYIYPHWGAKKLLVTSFILSLLLMPLLFVGNHVWLGIIISVFGFVLNGTNPVTIVMGQKLLPNSTGLASGLTMGMSFGIGGLGTFLTGRWADSLGVVNALYLTALVLIPAGICTIMLTKNRLGQSKSQSIVAEGVS